MGPRVAVGPRDPRRQPDLRRARALNADLTTASVPPIGGDDHARGEGPEAILYLDLGCPHCAAAWRRLAGLELRLCFRHFPVASKHRRAQALHTAAEAAAHQGEEWFWGMVDATYADHGRQDDPHLWERATALGLDLERFDRDRRSAAVAQRVRRDFESGIRAGVATTPTAFAHEQRISGGELLGTLATMARD